MTKKYTILHGDCIDRLKELPDNSVDSCVTDPPYGLSKEPDISEVLTKWLAGEPYDHGHGGFMGKAWDSFVPHPDIWKEVYRVLKPGGHALVFAGTRTQDLMTVSLRMAGFEVRDVIEWLYFSGFPKSMDVGKAFDRRRNEDLPHVLAVTRFIAEGRNKAGKTNRDIDEYFGFNGMAGHWTTQGSQPQVPKLDQWAELKTFLSLSDEMDTEVWRLNGRKGKPGDAWEQREKVGEFEYRRKGDGTWDEQSPGGMFGAQERTIDITTPATELARKWDGWGTATKPSHEPVLVVTKPKTIEDVLDDNLKEVANCLSLFVKIAVQNSTLSLRDYVEELDSARNRVVPKNNIQDVLSGVTDTSQLKTITENINWNTALSCLITLGDRLKNGNTYTTETALNTIIELKTLKYFQSLTTLESIIKDATSRDGESMNAEIVANFLNEELSRLSEILTLPVPENATSKQEEKDSFHKHEPIIVVRKPLIDADTGRKLTVVDCVEKYGTGAINIDACRVGNEIRTNLPAANKPGGNSLNMSVKGMPQDVESTVAEGRFPANCVTTEPDAFYSKYFNVTPQELSKKASKKDRNSDWRGEEIDLPERVKVGEHDGRNAFPKNSAGEKGKHSPKMRNTHPTVKPTDLMAWLVRLVTPPGGTVLDPFAGSGSTLVAAKREGFGFIGIEREAEYVEIIEARTGESETA